MSVSYEIIRNIAVLSLKNPPLNGFSRALRTGLLSAIDRAHGEPGVEAVVVIGSGSNFSAGADIKEFQLGGHRVSPTLGEVHLGLEQSSVPVVAALHGHALGGGLETALACHWRVASSDKTTRLALPEVHLGILPGAGGTQRLPRLAGARAALELMLSGRAVGAQEALTLNLVDALVCHRHHRDGGGRGGAKNKAQLCNGVLATDGDFLGGALEFVEEVVLPYHLNSSNAGSGGVGFTVASKLVRHLPPPLFVRSPADDDDTDAVSSSSSISSSSTTTDTLASDKNNVVSKSGNLGLATLSQVSPPVEPRFFDAAREALQSQSSTAFLRAPLRIVSAVEFGCGSYALPTATTTASLPPPAAAAAAAAAIGGCDWSALLDAGLDEEARLFRELESHDQSRALQYAFFAERGTCKEASEAKPREVRSVGVVGSGTMGCGIAMALLDAKPTGQPQGKGGLLEVVLVDQTEEAVLAGKARIEATYRRSRKFNNSGDDKEAQLAEKLKRLTVVASGSSKDGGGGDYSSLSNADLVVEAVVEDLGVKQKLFCSLAKHCKPSAVLASNTSTLSIDGIAQALKQKDGCDNQGASGSSASRVVGMHFFSPAHVMRLVETVAGDESSGEALATAMALGKRLGKVPVLAGNCFGFIGNRMLEGYGHEACFAVEEGAQPEQVDAVLTEFGMAMGFFAMSPFGNGRRYPTLLDAIPMAGFLGQKVGKGWYDYGAPGGRAPSPHPAAEEIVEAHREQQRRLVPLGPQGNPPPPTSLEIYERTLFSLVNEGFKVLGEGKARSPEDIDVVWCQGYGFPRWRGGPMHWADTQLPGGLPHLLTRLRHWHALFPHSPHLKPAPLLEECVGAGEATLAEFWKKKKKKKKTKAVLEIEK